VPAFATYFSGAPVLYPPVGAVAAALGGLAGARLLSLAFMLASTAALHGLTRRIFDRRAAFLAAAVYAGLAGTQFLGALATYDAMALCLLALAAWLAVVAADRPGGADRCGEAGQSRKRTTGLAAAAAGLRPARPASSCSARLPCYSWRHCSRPASLTCAGWR
jgi:4-amino-4-deoxy-L-arabinose transferase-like glycosyltransferase